MLRKLALSLAVAGVLSATQANALGLGQIRIKSALNEPLDAEIQLLQVRDLDPQQIQPQMADIDQFAIAGLDRSRLLSSVKFAVDVHPNGTGVIRLTSTQPVREPFLNLLVEVNWPSGRLVREYTLLLDPPVFEAAPIAGATAPVQAPVSVAPTRAGAQQLSAPESRRSSGPVDNIRTRASGNQVWVEAQDTLGQLARRHSPGGGTTLNQMMLALQRKNPNAFLNGNINFLKAGTVLNLPTLEEVRAMTPAEASSEVSRQMQAWKTGRYSAAAPSVPGAPQMDGSKKKPLAPAESEAAAPAQDQLKILTAADPNSSEPAGDDAGTQETARSSAGRSDTAELLQRNEALENQLAVTQETVDRVERENAELDEKLTAITQQLDTLQRLLELKDQQMAELQNQLQQAQAAPRPAPTPPPAPRQPEGLLETVMGSPAYMAGIGAVIGGLLVGLIGLTRRRKDEPQPYNPVTDSTATNPAAESEAGKPGEAQSFGAGAIAGTAAATAVAGATATWIEAVDDDDDTHGVASLGVTEHDSDAADTASELDLDMDLDLDMTLDRAAAAAEREAGEADEAELSLDEDEFDLSLDGAFEEETLLNDGVEAVAADDDEDEFDLSFDSDSEDEPLLQTGSDDDEEIDESLDDILGMAMGEEEEAALADLHSGMGQLEELESFVGEEPEDTLESLGLDSVIEANTFAEASEEQPTILRIREELEKPKVPVSRSAEEEEDYRLSMVQPILPDDDDLLDAVPPSSGGEEREAGRNAVAAAAEEAIEETVAPDLDEVVGEPAPAASAFEFDEDLADSEADEVAERQGSLESVLAQAGAELSLEDEVEETLDAEDELSAARTTSWDVVGNGDEDALELELESELEPLAAADATGDRQEYLNDFAKPAAGDSEFEAMLAALQKDFHDDDDSLVLEEDDEALDAALNGDDAAHLDSELEALLGSVDDEIALDESGAEDEDLGMDGLEFLDGTDEVETKLDLARAYIDMEDRDGAKDILSEILEEGSDKQQLEARKLMESLV